MECEECQILLCEIADSHSSPTELLRAHLTDCPECHSFHKQLLLLDTQLQLHASSPILSSNFGQVLMAQIASNPISLTPREVQQLKQRYQEEFEANLVLLKKDYLKANPTTLLRSFSFVLTIGFFLLTGPAFLDSMWQSFSSRFPAPNFDLHPVFLSLTILFLILGYGLRTRRYSNRRLTSF